MAKYVEMNYFNGSNYEPLYPSTTMSQVSGNLSVSRLTGTVPISSGGTNATSAGKGLYNLINGSSTQTTLATNDYISFMDYSSSNGGKITVSNLLNYLNNNLNIDSGGSGWEQYRSYSINLTGDQSTTLISNDSTLPKYDWFFRYNLSTFSVLPKAQNCGLAINQSIFAYWIPKGDETSVLNATNISDYYFYHYVTFYSHTGYYSYMEGWPNRPENKLRFLGYNKMGIDSYEVIYTYDKSSVGTKENTFVLNLMNGGSSARAVGTVTLYRKPNILTELSLDITK